MFDKQITNLPEIARVHIFRRSLFEALRILSINQLLVKHVSCFFRSHASYFFYFLLKRWYFIFTSVLLCLYRSPFTIDDVIQADFFLVNIINNNLMFLFLLLILSFVLLLLLLLLSLLFFLLILSYYCCYDEDRIENDSKKPLKIASIQVMLIFDFRENYLDNDSIF